MTAHKPGGGGAGVFVGVDPPASPADGALWWDTDDTSLVGGSQTYQTVMVPISSAEILAFDGTSGTAKTLVAAPGADKIVWPIRALLQLHAGGTPYSVSSSSGEFMFAQAAVLNDGWTTAAVWVNPKPLLESAVDAISSAPMPTTTELSSAATPLSDFTNSPLVCTVQFATVTLGDGTLTVYVEYSVVTLT